MAINKKVALSQDPDSNIALQDSAGATSAMGRDENGDTSLRRLNTGGTGGGLYNTGSTRLGVISPSASQTADDNNWNYTTFPYDCTSGAATHNLQAASGAVGKCQWVYKIDNSVNALTIARNGSDTIDGATSLTVSEQYSGYLLQCISSTAWKVLARFRGGAGMIFNSIVASSAVTGGTSGATSGTGAAYDQSYTFPANSLKAGDKIRFSAIVKQTGVHSTDTMTLGVLLGSSAVVQTAAVTGTSASYGIITGELTVRDIGASGHIVGGGTSTLGAAGTGTKQWGLDSTAIDTTGTLALTVKALYSNSDVGNTSILNLLSVERIPTN